MLWISKRPQQHVQLHREEIYLQIKNQVTKPESDYQAVTSAVPKPSPKITIKRRWRAIKPTNDHE